MDSDLASKIRSLALASRCLARELRKLKSNPAVEPGLGKVEADRLLDLARAIAAEPVAAAPATRRRPSKPIGSPSGKPASRTDHIAAKPPSRSHELALGGHGSIFPIPELVGFLGTLRKTGILRIATHNELFVIEFQSGDIVHGEASRAPLGQRLGDVLVSQGVIDRQTLQAARTGGAMRLGQTLLDKNLITPEVLRAALLAQIQLLFCRLFREEARGFTFWNGPPIHAHEGVRLNPTSLLLEGARVSDETADHLRALEATRLKEAS